ncbi:flippase-like domain-containing protein [Myxococcota bacterium]|nr:flippase-like domain-containing protein [Myxococcota bacterium]MBU1533902.1 flippase-like domain-containing protein [Myxococcota bacterium]
MGDNTPPDFSRGQHLGLRISLSLALAVIVYCVMALWAGYDELTTHLRSFPMQLFLLALGLSTGNFLLRFVRYHLLLLQNGIRVSLGKNLLIHFAGLSLTMTPGKVGEAIKSWFLHLLGHKPVSTLPVVFMERFTDLFSVLLLASFGVFTLGLGVPVFALSGSLLLALGVLLTTERGISLLGSIAAKTPLIRRKSDAIASILQGVKGYMTPKTLTMTLFFGALGWGAEAVAFYYIAQGAGLTITLFDAVFIYSISTLAGVVFPGGLGGMEGMMGLLLMGRGSPGAIVTSIFLIRLATLWWATLVGTGALITATLTIRPTKK